MSRLIYSEFYRPILALPTQTLPPLLLIMIVVEMMNTFFLFQVSLWILRKLFLCVGI